jgi:tRNA-splicing ligase RtcB
MTTFDAGSVTLERVRENVWEIPQQGGMNAPARVFASEALLEEIAEDRTLQQLQNSAHLPGITKYAVCMPDGHQGYGFPVGGVGAIDAEDGCISPGAVGYDINCLAGDAEVTLEFGRRRQIADLVEEFEHRRAVVAGENAESSPIRLATEDEATVYEVETETGETVRATTDHPFLTPDGMCELEELSAGDGVFVHPFTGVEDEDPDEFTVLAASDVDDPAVREDLSDRGLLPLRSTDREFALLLGLVGYHTGDGTFADGRTVFYGEAEDLERIRRDVREVGFDPSRVYSRDRAHEVDGSEFEATEHGIRVHARSFRRLVRALGAPESPTVESEFGLPAYFDRLADWQRALYLSGYFGAEMSAPAAVAPKNLSCPTVSQTRVARRADEGEAFLRGVADALEDIGVETNAIERFETDSNDDHPTVRLRFGVNGNPENLIRLFTRVGFRYASEKHRAGIEAAQYLKYRERTIGRREIASEARRLADGGEPVVEPKDRFDVDGRLVERSVYSGRAGRPRPPADFPDFGEFCEQLTVRDDGTVETTIASITEVGSEPVYDIGVEHEAHNFVADGFVVSNCGVRMVRTNLDYEDVRGREEELVEELFDAVPSGLGGGGVVESGVGTVEAVLDRGMEWALEQGYAVPADLEHCEDEGSRPESDPAAVSEKAKNRGKDQLGSLGSGNHFLEVQRVTDVYRDAVAEAYGLREDGVVVLIHCGSRGLGHQVCTDYLRRIEREHADLLERLPDRELAAAPAGSPLAEEYYQAMGAAINFAWVNRQLITHRVREVFERVFGRDWESMEMDLLYDVAHNIAKKETHEVEGDQRELYVHRKGATRAFPAGRPEVPPVYREVGQPVIIPGSMGAGSYVLRGGEASMSETFGSTAHGAGRLMSRTQAKQTYWGGDVQDDLREQKVYVKAQSGATVAEEAPGVYKDVDEVVRVSDALGIGDKIARTYPVCNVKG